MDLINISTNKNVLFVSSCICGAVGKLYDDLIDNYRLHKFSNPVLMEVLKGVFILTLAFTSIFNPLWFVLMWSFNFFAMILVPVSYELPYERSLYITSGLLFSFINYDKLFEQINDLYSSKYEVTICVILLMLNIFMEPVLRKIIELPSVPQWVINECNIDNEVSLYKLVLSFVGSIWFGFVLINQHNFTTQLFLMWNVGYLIIRICSQVYSLFVYKPKSFPLDESLNKQNISKEPITKEEEPKEEEPENKAETI
jgi:hypothetical protein